jgi:hypothetical protein
LSSLRQPCEEHQIIVEVTQDQISRQIVFAFEVVEESALRDSGLVNNLFNRAERLDTYGAFYLSPLDMIGFTFVGSLSLAMIVGITPQAVTVYLLVTMFCAIFQHANVHTPQWLGYIIQRPESHTIHHGRGLHRYNYCDFPIFDMLFGTFRNPQGYEMETGYYDGASARIIDMIFCKDISKGENDAIYRSE